MLNLAKSPKKESELSPNSLSLGFVESLYADYLSDPSSVSADWRRYFKQLTNGSHGGAMPRSGPSFRPTSLFNPPGRRRGRTGRQPARIRNGPVAGSGRPVGAGVPGARAHDRHDRSVGTAASQPARTGSRILRLHRSRISIGRFRPTRSAGPTCSPCVGFSPGCATPIAARSACSSCTWTI